MRQRLRRYINIANRIFNPRQLFIPSQANTAGALYDIRNLSSLFQNQQQLAVTTWGDPVGLVLDQQATGALRAVLDGVSGTYLSTPDSAAVSIVGDIDLRFDVALPDYTPSANIILLAKGSSVVPASLEYALELEPTGILHFYWSTGAATLSAQSTASVPFANLARGCIRVTLDADNGAGGNTVTFYSGTEFGTWTQLGSAVTAAGTTSIQNSTNTVALGSFTGGTSGLVTGQIFRAQIYNGIAGTMVADFDATRYTGGATCPSSTGETWTLNGNARIVQQGNHAVQVTAGSRPVYARHPLTGLNNLFTTATDTFTTRTFTTTAVEYTLSMKGTGTITLTGTSTDGPLVGTGAGNRVSLTFTPTAGTLTLTVAGSVTEGMINFGATALTYQTVTASYDVTQAGIADVPYLKDDGNDDFAKASITPITISTSGVAIFGAVLVLETTTSSDKYHLGLYSSTDADTRLAIVQLNGTGRLDLVYQPDAGGGVTTVQGPAITFGEHTVIASLSAAGALSLIVDGTEYTGSVSPAATIVDRFGIGAKTSTTDGSYATMGFPGGGFINRILTAYETANVNSYYASVTGADA